MAEIHPTSAAATQVPPIRGPTPDALQHDVDAIREEIKDLRTMLGSLIKEVKELKKPKAETPALWVPPGKVEVKSEPLETTLWVDLEETPVPVEQEDLDDEPMGITREEEEPAGGGGGSGNAPQDTGDAGERNANPSSRRYSTEEPPWITPSCEEVLFRVNPERAQRTAGMSVAVAPPIQPLTPVQPREETPPPPPARSPSSPSPASAIRPSRLIGIIPASQAKRKHNFELVIEIPAKRFKASCYPAALSCSSNGSVASSSRTTLNTTRTPVKASRNRLTQTIIRDVPSATFLVDVDPQIRDVVVTRDFMSSHFGAPSRKSFSQPPKDWFDTHGYDHFTFVLETSTSQAPTVPGEPCLVTLFEDNPWPVYDRYRVFGRVRVLPARWQYMGLYKATKLPAWTPEEIKRQRRTITWYWSAKIAKSKWALPMISRIMLRRVLGREPTGDEVDDQMKKLDKKAVPRPSVDDIVAALESGEEKAYPWKLECEDYEEDLQREIATVFPRYEKKLKLKDKLKRPNASART